jgi:hypothetical protein
MGTVHDIKTGKNITPVAMISIPEDHYRGMCTMIEYLAAMLAAHDGAILGKDREQQTMKWKNAAHEAVANGWNNTPDQPELTWDPT